MSKGINDIIKELIRETLWIHYNKEDMNNNLFEELIVKLNNDISLKEDLKSTIISYTKGYLNKY